jgi:hypothetical protein
MPIPRSQTRVLTSLYALVLNSSRRASCSAPTSSLTLVGSSRRTAAHETEPNERWKTQWFEGFSLLRCEGFSSLRCALLESNGIQAMLMKTGSCQTCWSAPPPAAPSCP